MKRCQNLPQPNHDCAGHSPDCAYREVLWLSVTRDAPAPGNRARSSRPQPSCWIDHARMLDQQWCDEVEESRERSILASCTTAGLRSADEPSRRLPGCAI